MRNFIVSVCILLASNFADALVIDCSHQINSWTNHGTIDECIVYYLSPENDDYAVEKVNIRSWRSSGTMPAEEIVSFYIRDSSSLHYIPSGLADLFVNLKVLVVAFTGLNTLRQSDFKPLTKLENIYLDNNRIEALEKDLFLFNPNIRYINFESNKIKSVASDVFKPLTRLEQLNFSNNDCFGLKAETRTAVQEMLISLYEQCALVDDISDYELMMVMTEPSDDYTYVEHTVKSVEMPDEEPDFVMSTGGTVKSFASLIILVLAIVKIL